MQRSRELVISSWIDFIGWDDTVQKVIGWATRNEPRYVCICNVHSVVTARHDAALRAAINGADLATPDGMPVAWLIGRRRGLHQARISGPDLAIELCREAESNGVGVAFFGSSPQILVRLQHKLLEQFPNLKLCAMLSPPFRPLTEDERQLHVRQLNESGAGIIFVGLGCPKQEIWMAAQGREVAGVLVGVGAAFEFMAGTISRPPQWMQRNGLEWLGRLIAEPRRLWRRYLVTNSIYLVHLVKEWLIPRRRQQRDEP